ncbi:tetratricopeptide repeat protein [bacterium]|nr:tetratricopeptide repeat protein [bacterium]
MNEIIYGSSHNPRADIFVGREKELGLLNGLLAEIKKGMGKVVLISAEPGGGKTALVRHFIDMNQECNTGIGECTDREGITEYQPFKYVLAELNADDLVKDEDPEKKSRIKGKVIGFIKDAGPAWVNAIPVIGGVAAAGLETLKAAERQFGNEVKKTVTGPGDIQMLYENELRRLAEDVPVIILLDDLQWSDPSSVNLIFKLGKTIRTNPFKLLLIGTYRPHDINQPGDYYFKGQQVNQHPFKLMLNELRGYKRKESHITNQDWLEEIELPPLAQDDIAGIITKRFPQNKFPKDFAKKLEEHSEGNPLFITEVLESIAEDEGITCDEEGYFILGKDVIDKLPDSIQGVISARIDRLHEQLRKILDYASVNGENFAAQVIDKVLEIDELELAEYLDDLAMKHGLVRHESIQSVREILLDLYKFTHVLIHKYVYESISESRRRILHKKFAQVLQSIYGDELDSNRDAMEEYNRHIQIASGHRNGVTLKLTDKKAETDEIAEIIQFAESALQKGLSFSEQFALDECLQISDEVQTLLAKLPELNNKAKRIQFEGLALKTLTLNRMAHFQEGLDYGTEMQKIAERLNDKGLLARSYSQQATSHAGMGRHDEAITLLKQAGSIYSAQDHHLNLVDTYISLGDCYNYKGLLDEALKILNDALDLLQKQEDPYRIAKIYNILGATYSRKRELHKSVECFEKMVKISEEKNYRYMLSTSYLNLAITLHEIGKIDQAAEYYQKSLVIKKKLNDQMGLARLYDNIGMVKQVKGELEEAAELLDKAITIWTNLEHDIGLAMSMGNKARVVSAMGDKKQTLELDLEVLHLFKKLNIKPYVAQAWNHVGMDYKSLNEHDKCIESHINALKLYEELGDGYGIQSASVCLGICYMTINHFEDALNYLEKSLKLSEKLDFVPGQALAHKNIGNVFRDKGEKDLAIKHYKKGSELYIQLNDPSSAAECLFAAGLLELQKGKPPQGEEKIKEAGFQYLNKAIQIWKDLGRAPEEVIIAAKDGAYTQQVIDMLPGEWLDNKE